MDNIITPVAIILAIAVVIVAAIQYAKAMILQVSFDELTKSYEALSRKHRDLGLAYGKLRSAHGEKVRLLKEKCDRILRSYRKLSAETTLLIDKTAFDNSDREDALIEIAAEMKELFMTAHKKESRLIALNSIIAINELTVPSLLPTREEVISRLGEDYPGLDYNLFEGEE